MMPYSAGKIPLFIEPLNLAINEFEINTRQRQAAFLAQVAVESGELRYTREIASGAAYEGRADLGNTQPGDGERFAGRGLLQATGRFTYGRISSALRIDCVTNPSLLEAPVGACRSAAYIWAVEKKLNPLADVDHFGAITKAINGGYNGIDARIVYWLVARKQLGL